MGKDGAEGMREMREAGAITLGQDEASSLIYGMPRVAFERGGVMKQYSLSHIAEGILDACDAAKAHPHNTHLPHTAKAG
jgi:two-component system chemotaxis response regulator CheB